MMPPDAMLLLEQLVEVARTPRGRRALAELAALVREAAEEVAAEGDPVVAEVRRFLARPRKTRRRRGAA